MKKKWVSAMLCAAVAVSALTGCGDQKAASNSEKNEGGG